MKNTERILGTVVNVNENGITLDIKQKYPGFLPKEEFEQSGIDYQMFNIGDVIDAFPIKKVQEGKEYLSLCRRGKKELSSIYYRQMLEEKLEKATNSQQGNLSAKEDVIQTYTEILFNLKNNRQNADLKEKYFSDAFDYLISVVQDKIDYEFAEKDIIDDYKLNDYIFKHCASLYNAKKGDKDFLTKEKDKSEDKRLNYHMLKIPDPVIFDILDAADGDRFMEMVEITGHIFGFNMDNADKDYLLFSKEKNLSAFRFFTKIADYLWVKYMNHGTSHVYLYTVVNTLLGAALAGYYKYACDLQSMILYCRCAYNYYLLNNTIGEFVGSEPYIEHIIKAFHKTEILPEDAIPMMHSFVASTAIDIAESINFKCYDGIRDYLSILELFKVCYKNAKCNFEYLVENDSEIYSIDMIQDVCDKAINKIGEFYHFIIDQLKSTSKIEEFQKAYEDTLNIFKTLK